MKKIIYYILCFITSVMLILGIFLLVGRFTVLSKNYVVKNLNKHNYKEETYDAINKSMKEYIPSSGFSDAIFKDAFTKEKVSKDIDIIIDGIYEDKIIKIDTTSIKNKLIDNMKKELNDNNLVANDEEIEKYADSIVDIYNDKIIIYNKITNYTHIINKINIIINVGIFVLISLSILLSIISLKVFKHSPYPVVFYTVGFSILGIIIYLYCNTNVNSISILSKATTNTVITIINNIMLTLIIISICFIILGTLAFFIRENHKCKVITKKRNISNQL